MGKKSSIAGHGITKAARKSEELQAILTCGQSSAANIHYPSLSWSLICKTTKPGHRIVTPSSSTPYMYFWCSHQAMIFNDLFSPSPSAFFPPSLSLCLLLSHPSLTLHPSLIYTGSCQIRKWPRLSSNLWPSWLNYPELWNYRHVPPCLCFSFSKRQDLNVLPRLVLPGLK